MDIETLTAVDVAKDVSYLLDGQDYDEVAYAASNDGTTAVTLAAQSEGRIRKYRITVTEVDEPIVNA